MIICISWGIAFTYVLPPHSVIKSVQNGTTVQVPLKNRALSS
jgi:hypothetical protein